MLSLFFSLSDQRNRFRSVLRHFCDCFSPNGLLVVSWVKSGGFLSNHHCCLRFQLFFIVSYILSIYDRNLSSDDWTLHHNMVVMVINSLGGNLNDWLNLLLTCKFVINSQIFQSVILT